VFSRYFFTRTGFDKKYAICEFLKKSRIMDEKTRYAQYIEHLEIARMHLQEALNAFCGPEGLRRPLWYRITLGRAQIALITLLTRESNWLKTGTEITERILEEGEV